MNHGEALSPISPTKITSNKNKHNIILLPYYIIEKLYTCILYIKLHVPMDYNLQIKIYLSIFIINYNRKCSKPNDLKQLNYIIKKCINENLDCNK